jgi:hypothetical protein
MKQQKLKPNAIIHCVTDVGKNYLQIKLELLDAQFVEN